jgi:hypothetical protein
MRQADAEQKHGKERDRAQVPRSIVHGLPRSERSLTLAAEDER